MVIDRNLEELKLALTIPHTSTAKMVTRITFHSLYLISVTNRINPGRDAFRSLIRSLLRFTIPKHHQCSRTEFTPKSLSRVSTDWLCFQEIRSKLDLQLSIQSKMPSELCQISTVQACLLQSKKDTRL